METTTLLDELRKEHEELGLTIRVLEKRVSGSSAASTPTQTAAKRGHIWTPRQRAEMSRKLRASWAKRHKKSAKK